MISEPAAKLNFCGVLYIVCSLRRFGDFKGVLLFYNPDSIYRFFFNYDHINSI